MVEIVPLAACPHWQARITDWLWQAFDSHNRRDFFASIVQSSLRSEGLPITFVALENGEPVGTVGLWRCDLLSRQDLSPWLAALYVDERRRDKGLGQALQRHVLEYSRRAGFSQLYLYAAFSGYYEKSGWRYMGDALDYPDKPVRLYRQALTE